MTRLYQVIVVRIKSPLPPLVPVYISSYCHGTVLTGITNIRKYFNIIYKHTENSPITFTYYKSKMSKQLILMPKAPSMLYFQK